MPTFDFDRSWREAAALIEQVKGKVVQIEEEQSTLDVKRDLARWLEKFESLSVELAEMREEANRGAARGAGRSCAVRLGSPTRVC